MSGLLFLSSEDFNVEQGVKGEILCHNIQGFSLILFYSTHCQYCHDIIPIFKTLPGTVGGCQFGMINISTNKSCVEKSQNTITPIKYVPYIVLYINGKPFMIYKGPNKTEDIKKFIIDTANNLQQRQQFSSNEKKENKEEAGIPAYTIGKPICGNDKVCYLDFTKAYYK